MDFYNIKIKNKDGKYECSEQYKDKVILIVNTASNCGLTDQFEQLEILYKKYKEYGFEIIGIPSNSFGEENNDSDGAYNFCKIEYGVSFKMMYLGDVHKDEIFKYLINRTKLLFFKRKISWNFEKFLVSKDGTTVKRYTPVTEPKVLESEIKRMLNI